MDLLNGYFHLYIIFHEFKKSPELNFCEAPEVENINSHLGLELTPKIIEEGIFNFFNKNKS